MDQGLFNAIRGYVTGVDEKKDGDYVAIDKMESGTISGVFKYRVNEREIQWYNNDLVNKNFGAILRGDKFKLSVKVVSQEVLETLPKGDYKFKGLNATVVGFYYKRNEDQYGTGWLEKQYVYELNTDYTFTIVATEQYLNGYRLLTFYPNVPFVEGTEYIKEIDPKYALIEKDVYGDDEIISYHLQDLNFRNYFRIFKDDKYIGSSTFKNLNDFISFLMYSNNKYRFDQQYLRSIIMNPTGLQYSIDIYDIGWIKVVSEKLVSEAESLLIKPEEYDNLVQIDDNRWVDNKWVPITSYKYYYFTTKDTFLGEYLNTIKIQQQNIIKEDFGCDVYYVKDKKLISTTLNMKSCMQIILDNADYVNGSSCMVHKFILNDKVFYIVGFKLVYALNCLITNQPINELREYDKEYLTIASEILKKYNQS